MNATTPGPSQVVSLIRTRRAEIETKLATVAPVCRRLIILNLDSQVGCQHFPNRRTDARWEDVGSVPQRGVRTYRSVGQILCALAALSSVVATGPHSTKVIVHSLSSP